MTAQRQPDRQPPDPQPRRGLSLPAGAATRPAPRRRAAAALRYEAECDAAPRVVASGSGAQAEQIVEIAREHNIPVHADPQLAELLAALDVGAAIPEELYLIVAEILIFVHEVDRGCAGGAAASEPPHAIAPGAARPPETRAAEPR